MYDHVTPFLKGTNCYVSNCSLINGLRDLIKNVSNNCFFLVYSGALVNTFC